MTTILTQVWTWIKANLLISIGILLVIIAVLFWKHIKRMFAPARRKVHHRASATRSGYTTYARRRRSLPRSVGMHKIRSRPRTRGGRVKKPWQIKGSRAARLRMAKIRRMR